MDFLRDMRVLQDQIEDLARQNNEQALDLIQLRSKVSAIGGSGGGGSSYVIDVNMSSGSITSYDLHSATAAGISSALSADPETKVILKIVVDEEASPVVVVPSLGNRARGEFSAIYMRALFSALDYSKGDVYGYDVTLRLNANGLDVMNYQNTAY